MILSKVHSKGMTHNDIKPSNFLVTSDSSLVLSDFELSKSKRRIVNTSFLSTTTVASVEGHSTAYAAPEILENQNAPDEVTWFDWLKLCDAFCLGITIFHVIL